MSPLRIRLLPLALVSLLVAAPALYGDAIDRKYIVTISPTSVEPGATTDFTIAVTNNLLSGQSNQIQNIKITVPSGFGFAGGGVLGDAEGDGGGFALFDDVEVEVLVAVDGDGADAEDFDGPGAEEGCAWVREV